MFNFFKNKQAPKTDKLVPALPEGVAENENALIVAVDKEGKAILRLSVQNIDENDSETFAKALFAVQSGLYKDQISELLAEIGASENGDRLEFIKELLGYYTIYFDMMKGLNYNKEDKPVVSPLKFSSLVNGEK